MAFGCEYYSGPSRNAPLGLVDVNYHLLLLSGVMGGGGGVMLSAIFFGL